jgi:hypothetical protein
MLSKATYLDGWLASALEYVAMKQEKRLSEIMLYDWQGILQAYRCYAHFVIVVTIPARLPPLSETT